MAQPDSGVGTRYLSAGTLPAASHPLLFALVIAGVCPMSFATKQIGSAPDVIAPDGSEVRILCRTDRGSMAHFTLPPEAVAKAVAHRTIDEVWYVVSGRGRMWRRLGDHEEIVELGAGVSLTLPVGTRFQFRADGDAPLSAVGVAMPPWPGDDEAFPVEGPWQATV